MYVKLYENYVLRDKLFGLKKNERSKWRVVVLDDVALSFKTNLMYVTIIKNISLSYGTFNAVRIGCCRNLWNCRRIAARRFIIRRIINNVASSEPIFRVSLCAAYGTWRGSFYYVRCTKHFKISSPLQWNATIGITSIIETSLEIYTEAVILK